MGPGMWLPPFHLFPRDWRCGLRHDPPARPLRVLDGGGGHHAPMKDGHVGGSPESVHGDATSPGSLDGESRPPVTALLPAEEETPKPRAEKPD